ncbi:zinc ribbon domain-containing protein [Nonomuraea sp. NPDC049504]|uniref:zinc ribbon domain-containing protein n=1 Tax=Nonomuraea sp. NPDC049504 TaxID=3154729 RepID=UPI003440BC86
MRRFALLAACLAFPAFCASPALAHDHPSGISDLVTPAVVRIEATARVEITLVDHSDELRRVERSYDVPVGSGSGIVVTPDGTMVTLTQVVKSEQNPSVYAANSIFADHYKVSIPRDFDKHTVPNDELNEQLQQCYTPEKATSACTVNVTTAVQVFRNTLPPDTKSTTAEIVQVGTPETPAVLKLSSPDAASTGLPTAPLATQVPGKEGSAVNVAGFRGRPSPQQGDHVDIAHLGRGGTSAAGRGFADPRQKVDEPPKLGALVDEGLRGGPVIGDQDGHVIGLLTGGGKDARMIGVREIASALEKAGIRPQRGAIDTAFETALTRFHTHYYGQAVTGFQRVLELSPGHVMAAEHLKTSLTKRGTAEDRGVATTEPAPSTPTLPLLAAGLLLAAALGGLLFLWRRRALVSASSGPLAAVRSRLDEVADRTRTVRRPPALSFTPDSAKNNAHTRGQYGEPVMRFCTACGMQAEAGHKFCGYCGHSLGG